MAEGGEDPNDNPFSFRKFSKKKPRSPSDTLAGASSDEKEDIFDIPDVQNVGPSEDDRQSRSVNPEDDRFRRKDENPFSFKKFLRTSTRPKANGGLSTLDLANDLPDFIQDHSTSPGTSDRRQRIPPSDVPLPDFALDSSSSVNPVGPSFDSGIPDLDIDNANPPGLDLQMPSLLDYEGGPRSLHGHTYASGSADRHFGSAGNPHMHLPLSGNESDPDVIEDDPDEILAIPQANTTGGLPDFLSDSAVNSVGMRSSLDNLLPANDDFLYHANGDYEVELRRLREENRELRSELDSARELAQSESRRVSDLVRQMEAMQKREAADTAALESMMHQVETNLTSTTQRAVLAENTVTKLKQEVRSLQAQLQLPKGTPAGVKASDDIVKEKARFASEQLASAAKNAEQTLQQLLSGVDTLKLVSSVLASIDKVTDAGAEGNTDDMQGGATGGGASAV